MGLLDRVLFSNIKPMRNISSTGLRRHERPILNATRQQRTVRESAVVASLEKITVEDNDLCFKRRNSVNIIN